VAGVAIPKRYGGAGAGLAEVCVVMEELGRNLTPAPMLGSAVLAAQAVLASGDDAACERLLPAIADGSAIAALAWTTRAGHWDIAETACAAAPRDAGGGWELDGEAHYVLDGDAADVLLVAASTPDSTGLFEVDPHAADVTRAAVTSMDDSRGLAVVRLTGARGRRVGGDAAGPLAFARDLACVALSAEQVGAAQRALELTVGHLLTRVQFGQVIGGFQALQHRAADLHVLVESARSLSRAVALLAPGGQSPPGDPPMGGLRVPPYPPSGGLPVPPFPPGTPGRRGEGVLLGGADPGGERDDPAARRHRHHLGAPGPSLPEARARRQVLVRQPGEASRHHRGQPHRRRRGGGFRGATASFGIMILI
jgi:alkylation response protein AidB-like acyl-CoA dehydrogenase